MRVLLIDTCGVAGSVALAETAPLRVMGSAVLPGRSASERLVPTVAELLSAEGWGVSELGAIAVVYGPGSFTGVRVGLSAALGLSEAGRVPIVVVSRLELLATMAGREGRVHALLDAGRGEFYWGEYGGLEEGREGLLSRAEMEVAVRGSGTVVVCEERVREAVAGVVGEEPRAVGGVEAETAPRVADSAAGAGLVMGTEQVSMAALMLVAEPMAADGLGLAVAKIVAGAFADAQTIEANYLRRTGSDVFARPATVA